jgi:Ni/Fe-hydrogenase subunit HybB-like protein
MSKLTYSQIQDDVLAGLSPPRRLYWAAVAILAAGGAWWLVCWIYQVQVGMGVAGINQPVAWAVYITTFVFWVGIGHAGTLISAILHLVRSRWRTSISRAAEAMTVFAVMTAGLMPLVHLGRLWVFYYIIPYPSERQLWPNFVSPLVWDVLAVSTYLIVSTIFWLVGLMPDAASARDRWARAEGGRHWRTRLYRALSLGWTGAASQWTHYGRAYLFFAALATPLVVSVHSVVSWDFAMGLLPGWHSTIFAPYFVAGAIHSGLAMVLTLLIPLRRLLRLERILTPKHFESVAKVMIATTLIVAYAYILEPFIAWHSRDKFEGAMATWRATGWIAPYYWALVALNVAAPLAFLFRRVRRSLKALFAIGVLVNVGMWLERWVIISGSLAHDFLPHNWGGYRPTWVEYSILSGSFGFFGFFFLLFAKFLPTVAVSDLKEHAAGLLYGGEGSRTAAGGARLAAAKRPKRGDGGVLGVFDSHEALVSALRRARENAFDRLDAYSPFRVEAMEGALGLRRSPVRWWTLCGALAGLAGGFALAIGASDVNQLWVGGKYTPRVIVPYCVVGFEGAILLGALGNLAGMLFHSRLGRLKPPPAFDPRFTEDRFGLFLACPPGRHDEARALMASCRAQEVRLVG